MSRSGYSDDCDDNWGLIRWRGAVMAAIRGARGRSFLKELASAMDAMPVKELIANSLEADGGFCALGVVGHLRGIDMSEIDPDDREVVATKFNIAPALAAEIVFENDECGWSSETGLARWLRMRAWVDNRLMLADKQTAIR